ncbi:MAG: metallophosphoesterase [Ilumatobacter sp.]
MTIIDVTTVTDTGAVVHVVPADGSPVVVHRLTGLAPDTDTIVEVPDPVTSDLTHEVPLRTLASPTGDLRCVFTTVNDVHFGEKTAGQIDDLDLGPIRRSAPGSEPYPELMNRAAVEEMSELAPAAVIVKGDLSLDGAPQEWAAFEACYRGAFGDRLHVVRGNHDAYRHQDAYAGDHRIDLPGVTIALLDTAIPGATTGTITADQLDWLDALAASSTEPVLVMGHHQQWIPGADSDPGESRRSDDYFGLHPDASDQLDAICVQQRSIVAYAAGHTHRHRVRRMAESGIASIEVGCTKDFPGTWAEYRVHDGAIMQVVHRMSSPEALSWSEPCRGLYADFDIDYGTYALGELGDRCFVLPTR